MIPDAETQGWAVLHIWQILTHVLLPIFPGIVGAALALKFLGNEITRLQRFTSFIGGMACVVYIAPAVYEVFNITGFKTQNLIAFLTGLFGLAVCRELFKEINEADLIGTFKRLYLGAGK